MSFLQVRILSNQLHPAKVVKNLGVWFKSDFSRHVQRVCKACFVQLKVLWRFKQSLRQEVAVNFRNTLVSSWLDYYNSLFRGLPGFNIRKLHSVQNSLARIVTNKTRYSHITLVLKGLHWLPVQQQLVIKIATIASKFLQSGYILIISELF